MRCVVLRFYLFCGSLYVFAVDCVLNRVFLFFISFSLARACVRVCVRNK